MPGTEGLRPQTRNSGALVAESSQQMGRRGSVGDADTFVSDRLSTPLPDAASIRRGPRLRHGRLTSSRTVGTDNHSVYGQFGRWSRGWAGTVGLWVSAGLLLVSLLALSSTLTGMADQIEYFGAADLAHYLAVAASGCSALVSSCGVLLIVCTRGCGQARQARRDEEEAWIEMAHRDRELPPLPPVVVDGNLTGDNDGDDDRAWCEFVKDESRLRRYVEGLEERIFRQRGGDVSRSVGVGASTAGGDDRAIREGSMVTIPLSLGSGVPGRGEAEAGAAVAAGTDAPRTTYASMLWDGLKRAASKGTGMGKGKGRDLTAAKASLSQRNLLRATTPEIGIESRSGAEGNLHSLSQLARASFLPRASPYWVLSGEEEAGPSSAQTVAAAAPILPDPLNAGDDVDDRFSIGSSGASSIESSPADNGKGKDKGKGLAL